MEAEKYKIKIAPSILAADFCNLGVECRRMLDAGVEMLHLDVMDGDFVDNISFGVPVVKSLRQSLCSAFLDTHLMIRKPYFYWQKFAEVLTLKGEVSPSLARITVHVESEHDVAKTLAEIRNAGFSVGLSLNPATGLDKVLEFLPMVDLLLVMTVVPGFGGQEFISDCLPKIVSACEFRAENNLDFEIQVDGGVNAETAELARTAGASVLVAGTYLFKSENLAKSISSLRI